MWSLHCYPSTYSRRARISRSADFQSISICPNRREARKFLGRISSQPSPSIPLPSEGRGQGEGWLSRALLVAARRAALYRRFPINRASYLRTRRTMWALQDEILRYRRLKICAIWLRLRRAVFFCGSSAFFQISQTAKFNSTSLAVALSRIVSRANRWAQDFRPARNGFVLAPGVRACALRELELVPRRTIGSLPAPRWPAEWRLSSVQRNCLVHR